MNGHNPLKTKEKFALPRFRLPRRAAYARPVLIEFGLVGALTQSGTGIDVESTGGMGMCSMDTMRSMC